MHRKGNGEEKKKKYILFVKTGFLKYAPVEHTFSSYLEALNFFNKYREMWGAGPNDYIIKSTAEIEREKQRREEIKAKRREMIQPLKKYFTSIAKRATEYNKQLTNTSTSKVNIQTFTKLGSLYRKGTLYTVKPPSTSNEIEEEEEVFETDEDSYEAEPFEENDFNDFEEEEEIEENPPSASQPKPQFLVRSPTKPPKHIYNNVYKQPIINTPRIPVKTIKVKPLTFEDIWRPMYARKKKKE